jgi:hypothetical protein
MPSVVMVWLWSTLKCVSIGHVWCYTKIRCYAWCRHVRVYWRVHLTLLLHTYLYLLLSPFKCIIKLLRDENIHMKGWTASWSVEKSFDLSAASQVRIFLLSVMLSKDILLQYMAYGQCVKMFILSSCNPFVSKLFERQFLNLWSQSCM